MIETTTETEETGTAMVRTEHHIELPDDRAAQQAAYAAKQLTAYLKANATTDADIQLVGEDVGETSTSIPVPAIALGILVDVLDELADGNAVAVVPVQAEMTSQQAADLLNVSRPYLIKLLDGEHIPYRRVGNRRKILLTHLLEYRQRDEMQRRRVADKLTQEAERIGLAY